MLLRLMLVTLRWRNTLKKLLEIGHRSGHSTLLDLATTKTVRSGFSTVRKNTFLKLCHVSTTTLVKRKTFAL